jgi:transposase-like protein
MQNLKYPMKLRSGAPAQRAGFSEFQATQLYCPKCKQANPVRERLLLVLPTGDLREYVCAVCGESVGKKTN